MIPLALLLAAAPPVSLDIDPCTDVSPAEVRRILELELAATRASIRGLTGSVGCDGDALTFEVEDPLTGKQLSRKVELARAVPNVRARMLALAMVEAVEASWDEVLYAPVPAALREPEPMPEPPPVPLPTPPMVVAVEAPVPVPVPEQAPRFQFAAVAVNRALLSTPMWQWGGGLRFVHTPFRYLGWAAEATAEYGQLTTALGAVQMVTGGGALEGLGQYTWRRLTVQLALGFRGGAVNARGIPQMPLVTARDVTGPWAGPHAALSASVALGWWTLTGRFELGTALLGVPAHVDTVQAGMLGPWVGLSIAVGLRT